MKFDFAVGNPPYQNKIRGDNKTFATPVYNRFMEATYQIADKVSLITPARFLFNAGATPKDFNEKILRDEHVKVAKFFRNSSEVFSNARIKGGVVITYRDAAKNFGAIETFTPFAELTSILKKVVADKNFLPFNEIVYPRAEYRLAENNLPLSTNAFDKLRGYFLDAKPADGREYVRILGRAGAKRIYKWICRELVADSENLARYKVFIVSSSGAGEFGEILSAPIIGLPFMGATETFTAVGNFDSRAEAEACLKYIKSKFARALLGILKVTQHNPAATWAKVPLQNFSADSDIDWEKNIDAQLYRKYDLNDAETNFIETHVKEMI